MLIALTPTGGRPDAFALCERWMKRQTRKPDLWIVIDDCLPRTKLTMGQVAIAPTDTWNDGSNSQGRNLLAALDFIDGEVPGDHAICLTEDDDAYASDYVEKQEVRLEDHEMVGEQPARYYHVRHGAYHEFGATPHASLAATAIRSSMIPALREACELAKYIDMYLWRKHSGGLYHDHSVIGIKGMPGRPGVSDAHRRESGGYWTPDADGRKLREWLGPDAELYARFRNQPAAAPVWTKYPNPENFEVFLYNGQERFRCPYKKDGCAHDHYNPALLAKHIRDSHEVQEAPGTAGFEDDGSDGKLPERRIIIAKH